MKKIHRVFLLLVMLAAVASAPQAVQAQSGGGYDLTWNTVGGGGGTFSAGGGYELGGSVGQADAYFTHAGGSYTLKGGFWVFPLMRAYVPILRRGS